MSDPVVTKLEQAIAAFQATRSLYPSSSDQAQTELLLLLAQEVIALCQARAANAAGTLPVTGPTTHLAAYPDNAEGLLRSLAEQIRTLQEIQQAQESEIAQLRAKLTKAPKSQAEVLRRPIPQSPPRQMRPMEYWVAHVPDYGESLSENEINAFLARPRVRPEDLPIEPVRKAQPYRRDSVLSPAARESLLAVGPAIGLFVLTVAIALLFVLLSVFAR